MLSGADARLSEQRGEVRQELLALLSGPGPGLIAVSAKVAVMTRGACQERRVAARTVSGSGKAVVAGR